MGFFSRKKKPAKPVAATPAPKPAEKPKTAAAQQQQRTISEETARQLAQALSQYMKDE